MKVIVVSSGLAPLDAMANVADFKNHDLYPGSIWYAAFAAMAFEKGYSVIGATTALTKIEQKTLAPADVVLVQERESGAGLRLLGLGARGAVLTCLESPVYASKFYARLPKISRAFDASFLFPPYVGLSRAGVSMPAFFPRNPTAIGMAGIPQRRGCSVVATFRGPIHTWPKRAVARLAVDSLRSGPVRRAAIGYSSMTRRRLVEAMSAIDDVDVYGRHWPAAEALSPSHANRVHLRGPVESKEAALRAHRFNLCIENTSVAGYVTEKFADAVSAGCVPIYASENLQQAVESFDPPFVDAQSLLASRRPALLMDRAAEYFDEWLATPGNLQTFLMQFDYCKFARRVMQQVNG